jgi:FkbM family methyltransferase
MKQQRPDTPCVVRLPRVGVLEFALHRDRDIWISDVIRNGVVFDESVLLTLVELTCRGDVFLDVGANIGWFSIIGARLVGASGKVYAVEPEPENLGLLHKNIALNACDNVDVIAAAAGERQLMARLYKSNDNQGDHRLELTSDRADWIDVPVQTLDDVLSGETRPVGVVKMDTQGSEVAALRGMKCILERSPMARLVLEFWPYGLSRCGYSVDDLAQILLRRNDHAWLLRHDGSTQRLAVADLSALAEREFSIESQGHADIVSLAVEDRTAAAVLGAREFKPCNLSGLS